MQKVRQEVVWFAEYMEKTLKENDYKGGWKECGLEFLLNRLREEVFELERAIGVNCPHCGHKREPETWRNIVSESADVANFAMMIADITRNKQEESSQ